MAQPAGSALIVMAKRPSPGRTKTRLSPPFSGEEAARLYECFLRDMIEIAGSVADATPLIAYAPGDAAEYFRTLAPHIERMPQVGTTLGERLAHVLMQTLESGFLRVAAINSDSPTLPPAYIEQAFRRLADAETDVVVGPCEDGGYYLIGWKRPHPKLVRELEMSTSRVLEDTLAIARSEQLRVALLPTWYDVDEVQDLERLEPDLLAGSRFGRHTRQFLNEHRPASSMHRKRQVKNEQPRAARGQNPS